MNTENMDAVQESNSARKRRLAKEHNARNPLVRVTDVNTLPRSEKEELNALSKDVFGASSRWQRLVTRGYVDTITEETTEYVPGEKDGDEGTTRQVQVPVKRHDGAHQSTTVYHTVESIKAYMVERKVQLDKIREMIRLQQEEAQKKKDAAELAKKVHAEIQGSAV